jgi:hypothetical protein
MPVLLTLSVMGNAILIAVVATGIRGDQPSTELSAALSRPLAKQLDSAVATTTTMTAKKPPRVHRRNAHGRRRVKRHAAPLLQTTREVERKILTIVTQAPRGKLPAELIDPKTGLARNNLQAICEARRGSRSYLCAVRSARPKAKAGLYVRYFPGRRGRAAYTWLRDTAG